MLIDDVTIKIRAGKGGDGRVAFNKNMRSLGPVGGTGGNGGSIYAEGISDLGALNQFRFKKELKAEDGQNGKGQYNDGNRGEDLIIKVPVGTVVHNLSTGRAEEIILIGERKLLAKGGRGGKGNFHFRSATNTSPKEFQHGLPGEAFQIRLELKLIADVGFVGLPNVGKSSMLNELTNAKSKVANYQFTTLEPNLGVYYDMILADIPGLIEGASTGKGLGDKFLRHIERTGVLFHFLSADSEDPVHDYKTIRNELAAYNDKLAEKTEYVIFSKADSVSPEELKKKITKIKKLNSHIIAASIHDVDTIEQVKKLLNELSKAKHA